MFYCFSVHVREDLRQLERCVSTNEIQGLYKESNYSAVIARLQPLFDQEPKLEVSYLIHACTCRTCVTVVLIVYNL